MIKKIDPYRVLFPIGTVYSLVGVSLWLLFAWIPQTSYPGPSHSKMMIGGFLLAYIMGFLMTAIPKLTASFPAELWEIGFASTLVVGSGVLSLNSEEKFYYGFIFAGFCFLLSFGFRRVFKRTKTMPDFFIFVGSGLLSGFVGALFLFLSSLGVWSGGSYVGRPLLFQGMIIFLVLGIGCRLIPVISGVASTDVAKSTGFWKRDRILFLLAALLVWISFGFEIAGWVSSAYLLRALTVTCVAVTFWKLFARPKSKSRLALLIKSSAAMVPVGLWMASIQPTLAQHWMHLTYVGGFGLMTFTVASRVTLAHGGYNLSFETRSKSLYWTGGCLLAAAVTRAAAPHIPSSYLSHIQYSAILWLAGVVVWAWVFGQKMIKTGDFAKSC